MISATEKEAFRSRGWLRIRDFLPAEKVAAARAAVLTHLEKQGIRHDHTWRLGGLPLSTAPNAGKNLVRGFKHLKQFAQLIGEEVHRVVEALLDEPNAISMGDPQLLFTLPNAANWTVPATLWHLDLPRLPDPSIPGVQIFTFLDTVVPGGGGTLVVAGSHRLLNEDRRLSSQQVKKLLKREPYFQDLMSREFAERERFLQEPGRVGDVELQVVEIHGEPGDVFFTDLRLLHTIAPNAASAPRIMLTERFLRESLRDSIYAAVTMHESDASSP